MTPCWTAFARPGLHPVHCGLMALESLRLEKGYRDFAVDIDNTDTPLQAGLGFVVDFTKPDFIGRAALVAQKAAGPLTRRIVQFLLEDPGPLLHGNEPILCDGRTVGYHPRGGLRPDTGRLGRSWGGRSCRGRDGRACAQAAGGRSRFATAWCPPPPRSHRCTTRKASVSVPRRLRPDVLVLGAGMAGLGAARVLQDAGIPVTVIEARDRIGGRTHTSHLWPDLPVDMGASWIHGTKGNPLTALAKELGLKVTPTTYDRSATFDENGREIDFIKAAQRDVGPGRKGPQPH